jgi:hypothetical protein
VTLFPGVPRVVRRQVTVPAAAPEVMRWLSDSARRERSWRARTEFLDSLREWRVAQLRNGGLRFDYVQVDGDTVVHRTVSDVRIGPRRIDRVFLVRRTRRSGRPWRRRATWLWRQSVRVEPIDSGTASVEVLVRGRPARLTILTHVLAAEDAAKASGLTSRADRVADSTVAALERHFATREETAGEPG